MYQQTDGVAMGFPLGPVLTNIFVGYQEILLFLNMKKPFIYYCYINDTFAILDKEDEYEKFLSSLNSFYSLRFMLERELNSPPLILDILFEKHRTGFITIAYRKPTFTGQYLHW